MVSKALLEEYSSAGVPAFLVAIKTLKDGASTEARDELLREAVFMAQLDCEHIIGLHGVVTASEPLTMVLEYCEFGSLLAYMRENSDSLTLMERMVIVQDACLALRYLAEKGALQLAVQPRPSTGDNSFFWKNTVLFSHFVGLALCLLFVGLELVVIRLVLPQSCFSFDLAL